MTEPLPAWYATLTSKPEMAGAVVLPGVPPADEAPVVIGNPAAYVEAALEREASELAETGEGGRNHRLNAAAFAVGRLIAAGLPLDEDVATDALMQGALLCGLGVEDGDAQCLKTIRSGLRGGARHPLPWVEGDTVTAATPFVLPAGLEVARLRSSWWPVNVPSREDEPEEPEPTLLRRTDAVGLAYAGKVNALIGESESGKTWVALEAIRQVLEDGGVVGMLDFEDSYGGIKARLAHMGIPADVLARFYYCSPDESLDQRARDDLAEFLTGHQPALVVVDGVNAAMTLLGLELADNTDVTRFTRDLLKPLTTTGAGVITVDHVTKNRDGRGSYAIGAQAKRADVNGAALMVEVVAPFGRGMTGRLKLTVSKDRPGHVRAHAVEARHAAEAVIASNDGGDVTVSLYAVGIEDIDPVAEVMETLSIFLEATAEMEIPTNYKDLAKAIARRENVVRNAEQKLITGLYAVREHNRWRHLRRYRRRGVDPALAFDPAIAPGALPVTPGVMDTIAPALPSLSGSAAASPDREV